MDKTNEALIVEWERKINLAKVYFPYFFLSFHLYFLFQFIPDFSFSVLILFIFSLCFLKEWHDKLLRNGKPVPPAVVSFIVDAEVTLMKYREESQKSLQPARPNAPSTQIAQSSNPTSSIIHNLISTPPITSTSLAPIQNSVQPPEPTPNPRRYINPVSPRFSIINSREVESIPPVEIQLVKPTHQPLLHCPPRSLAKICVISPTQQPNQSTRQPIMSQPPQQPATMNQPDADNAALSQPVVEFREIYNKQALNEFHHDALYEVLPSYIDDLSHFLLAMVDKIRPMLHTSLA